MADTTDRDEIVAAFHDAVNMDAADLSSWLETRESWSVGWPKLRAAGEESVGHASGRRIVSILGKGPAALDDADFKHMRKVVGYVRRHLAQRPLGDVMHSRWRYSLMNWGHDPIR
jgi:Protein of unknown function (DUF3140)